jgi:predicted PurR-regulated permease PerM
MVSSNKPNPTPAAPPDDGDWFNRQHVLVLVLLAATVLAFWLCWQMVQPFLPALAWAMALAVVARPIHTWVIARFSNPDVAAAIAVVVVGLLLLVPAAFVINHLVNEVAVAAERVEADAIETRWQTILANNPRLKALLDRVGQYVDIPAQVERLVSALTEQVRALVATSVWTAVQVLLMLFALFFLFRDRRLVLEKVRSLVPLADDEADAVFTRVADTIHASIYGTLLVALVQGFLGGLMFWFLGLPTPVLWGVVMALLAVIPYLGAFVIWFPAAIFLALEGEYGRALALFGWGAVVVSLVDNLLYPLLVGGRMRLHTLPVFFAILGGLTVFGMAGLVLGPVVLALTLALVEIWRRRTAGGRTAEAAVAPGGPPTAKPVEPATPVPPGDLRNRLPSS